MRLRNGNDVFVAILRCTILKYLQVYTLNYRDEKCPKRAEIDIACIFECIRSPGIHIYGLCFVLSWNGTKVMPRKTDRESF